MPNPVLGIDVVARLDQLRADLAKIGPEGAPAAKALTAALSKEIRALEKASRDAAKQAKDTSKGIASLGSAASATGQSAAKLRGMFAALSPEMGGFLGGINDVADGFEVAADAGVGMGVGVGAVAGGLLALAAATAVAALGYAHFTEDSRRAETIQATFRDGLGDVEGQLRKMERMSIEAAAATDDLTDAQRRVILAHYDAEVALDKVLDKESEYIKKAAEMMDKTDIWPKDFDQFLGRVSLAYGDMADALDRLDGSSDVLKFLTGSIDGLTTSTSELTEETWAHIGVQVQAKALAITQAAIDEAAIKRDEAARLAKQRRAEAEREMAAALGEVSAALQSENDAAADTAEMYRELGDKQEEATQKATYAALDGIDKIEAARQRELQSAADLAAERARLAIAGSDAETEAFRAGKEQQAAINKQFDVEVAKARTDATKDAAEAAKKAADDLLAQTTATATSSAAILGDLSGFFQELSDEQVSSSKEGAMGAFNAAKAAAAAQALVNTYLAVTAALTIPPPFGQIQAGIVGGLGFAEVAKITAEQPSFADTPGLMRMDGGGSVKLAPGDYFAASQSKSDLQKQVAGGGQPVVRVVSENRYGHRIFDRLIRDNVQMDGPLARKFREGKRVGHREDR